MPVNYNNLCILPIKKIMKNYQLCKVSKNSPSTFTKINKPITMDVLVHIFKVMNCDFGDVVEVIKENAEVG